MYVYIYIYATYEKPRTRTNYMREMSTPRVSLMQLKWICKLTCRQCSCKGCAIDNANAKIEKVTRCECVASCNKMSNKHAVAFL